ncbi:hypothetical protein MKZ38_008481 [Zalerion maritima]|uniref:Uncharacterized protein n=1 Tax=Zalerion maritima TaxID=339359 RepID=A0AAD5RVC1_9PEZI|nr:hypothetical protein MKZ38_008481 [Zalerion maritima]
MPTVKKLLARGNAVLLARENKEEGGDHVVNLLIVFMGLLFLALLLAAVLVLVRRTRRQQRTIDAQNDGLPQYNDVKRTGNHRHLTIQTGGRQSILVFNKDGQPMLSNPNSPPDSPDNVPEIHITFPDEQDEQGRPRSGRVVVVRVGDTSVGLEPVQDEQLPAYEKESSSSFYSVDIDQIGGLKEKDRTQFV